MWWIRGQKCFEQLSVYFFVERDALQTLCVFKTAAPFLRCFLRRKNTQVSLTKPILKLTQHYTNFSPTHLGCITSHLGCTSCWHPRHLWSSARFLLWNAKPLRGAAKLHVVQPAKRHEDTRPFFVTSTTLLKKHRYQTAPSSSSPLAVQLNSNCERGAGVIVRSNVCAGGHLIMALFKITFQSVVDMNTMENYLTGLGQECCL